MSFRLLLGDLGWP